MEGVIEVTEKVKRVRFWTGFTVYALVEAPGGSIFFDQMAFDKNGWGGGGGVGQKSANTPKSGDFQKWAIMFFDGRLGGGGGGGGGLKEHVR